MDAKHLQIALFARAPVAGLTKTRLIPALGPVGAARLHRRLMRHALETAHEADLGPVTIWVAGQKEHRFFRALIKRYGCEILAQRGAGLGERMHYAFACHLPRSPTLLIGSDVPSLTAHDLREAASCLQQGHDAFLVSVADGGYGLLALNGKLNSSLFTEIPWGTSTVAAETRRRFHRLGMTLAEGPLRWDVDTPDDLLRLRTEFPRLLR